MSMLCTEDGRPMVARFEAFGATTTEAEDFKPICHLHTLSIPRELWLPSYAENGVLDIYDLWTTAPDMDSPRDLQNAQLDEYRFSLSRDVARTFLPTCFGIYLA